MKPRFQFLVRKTLPLLVGATCAVSPAFAQKTNSVQSTNKSATAKEKQPAVPLELPKSVFLVPSNSTEGKDPFYPRSVRRTPVVNTTKPNVPVAVVPDLVFTSISGTAENPLAVINNVNFGPGETRDVFLPGGRRLQVQCLEINLQTQTAVVQASGQRQTLHLKKQ